MAERGRRPGPGEPGAHAAEKNDHHVNAERGSHSTGRDWVVATFPPSAGRRLWVCAVRCSRCRGIHLHRVQWAGGRRRAACDRSHEYQVVPRPERYSAPVRSLAAS